MKTNEQQRKKVLNKFTILCWATFIAILGCTRPAGHRLDTPERNCPVSTTRIAPLQVWRHWNSLLLLRSLQGFFHFCTYSYILLLLSARRRFRPPGGRMAALFSHCSWRRCATGSRCLVSVTHKETMETNTIGETVLIRVLCNPLKYLNEIQNKNNSWLNA